MCPVLARPGAGDKNAAKLCRQLGTSGIKVSALSFGAWVTVGKQLAPGQREVAPYYLAQR
jgi:hypothetical protein